MTVSSVTETPVHQAPRASPKRNRVRGAARFSNREIVGCEAKRGPSTGSRSSGSFWIAKLQRRAAPRELSLCTLHGARVRAFIVSGLSQGK
jgi:hypothetical protein